MGNPREPGYNVGTTSTFECQANFPGDFECRNDGQWHAKYPRRYPERKCSKYKARHAHKRLYMVLPKYSKIQVLPGITSCRLMKCNKQAIELNDLLKK